MAMQAMLRLLKLSYKNYFFFESHGQTFIPSSCLQLSVLSKPQLAKLWPHHHRNHSHSHQPHQGRKAEPSRVLIFSTLLGPLGIVGQGGEISDILTNWRKAHETTDRQSEGGEKNALVPVVHRQRHDLDEIPPILHNQILRQDSEDFNHHKDNVLVKARKHIEIVADGAGIELVKHLAKHEGGEYNGVMLSGSFNNAKIFSTDNQQIAQQNDLEKRLHGNVRPHHAADQRGVATIRASLQEFLGRRLSTLKTEIQK